MCIKLFLIILLVTGITEIIPKDGLNSPFPGFKFCTTHFDNGSSEECRPKAREIELHYSNLLGSLLNKTAIPVSRHYYVDGERVVFRDFLNPSRTVGVSFFHLQQCYVRIPYLLSATAVPDIETSTDLAGLFYYVAESFYGDGVAKSPYLINSILVICVLLSLSPRELTDLLLLKECDNSLLFLKPSRIESFVACDEQDSEESDKSDDDEEIFDESDSDSDSDSDGDCGNAVKFRAAVTQRLKLARNAKAGVRYSDDFSEDHTSGGKSRGSISGDKTSNKMKKKQKKQSAIDIDTTIDSRRQCLECCRCVNTTNCTCSFLFQEAANCDPAVYMMLNCLHNRRRYLLLFSVYHSLNYISCTATNVQCADYILVIIRINRRGWSFAKHIELNLVVNVI